MKYPALFKKPFKEKNKTFNLKKSNGTLPSSAITEFIFWQSPNSRAAKAGLLAGATPEQLGSTEANPAYLGRGTVKVLNDPRLIADLRGLDNMAYFYGVPLKSIGDYRSLKTQEDLFKERYSLNKNDQEPGTKVRTYQGKKWYLIKGKAPCAPPGYSNHRIWNSYRFQCCYSKSIRLYV